MLQNLVGERTTGEDDGRALVTACKVIHPCSYQKEFLDASTTLSFDFFALKECKREGLISDSIKINKSLIFFSQHIFLNTKE